MDTYRIKIKIGNNEFEAEGPSDIVREQFEAFKQLVSSIPIQQDTPEPASDQQTIPVQQLAAESGLPIYDKVFKVDGRVISLTALPGSLPDAILMLAFGQRHYRKNDSITGSELMDGLKQSGYKADRIDRQMDKFVTEGLVIRIGAGRGTRYRLTNQGLLKSQMLTKDLLATVP